MSDNKPNPAPKPKPKPAPKPEIKYVLDKSLEKKAYAYAGYLKHSCPNRLVKYVADMGLSQEVVNNL